MNEKINQSRDSAMKNNQKSKYDFRNMLFVFVKKQFAL